MAVNIPLNQLDPASLISSPARPLGGVALTGTVTPSDTLDYGDAIYARWLYVGVTGNVSFVRWDGVTQVLANLAAGVFHPICSKRVNSTGTTATNMVWGN